MCARWLGTHLTPRRPLNMNSSASPEADDYPESSSGRDWLGESQGDPGGNKAGGDQKVWEDLRKRDQWEEDQRSRSHHEPDVSTDNGFNVQRRKKIQRKQLDHILDCNSSKVFLRTATFHEMCERSARNSLVTFERFARYK